MSIADATDDPDLPGSERELVGCVLRGTYRIDRVLDRGGMGTVFAAEHVRLRRPTAVKVLARHLAADENAVARFRREAEIISQLAHPHIVSILDFDTTDSGEAYIVMELLHGETLADRLDREQVLAPVEATRIVGQIAAALAAAHASSIVHRDLKPANIFLVQAEGAPPFVKLLDFGISKSAVSAAQSQRVTREFDVLGTPDYMAPEQALGRTALVDHRGDQFALAVITYEMLTGCVPFEGDSVMSVLYRVAHAEARPVSELAPHVPPGVDAVIARALEKRPEQRFSSIVEFAAALASAVGCSIPPASLPFATTQAPPPPGLERDRRDSHLRASSPPSASDSGIASSAPTLLGDSIVPQGTIRTKTLADGRPRVEAPPSFAADPRDAALPTTDDEDAPLSNPPTLEVTQVRSRATYSFRPPPSAPPTAARAAVAVDRFSERPPAPSVLAPATAAAGRESAPPRARSSAPAPSSSHGAGGRRSLPPLGQVAELIKLARQSLGFEELDLAVEYAQSAMRVAQHSDDVSARTAVEAAQALFERIFVASLGGLERRIVVRRLPSTADENLAPDEAFLLSRIWQGDTVDQVVDVASLPRPQTLRALVSLMRAGIISTE
jgi:serine/threonine-protein kinase